MKIKTNSLEPGDPKDTDTCTVFQIYQAFASEEETNSMRKAYADGIAWGEAKQQLFELIDAQLSEPRERYDELMANPATIEQALQQGAERARAFSAPFLAELRSAVGIRSLA